MKNKFEVGEVAILTKNSINPSMPKGAGKEVEILAVGPFPPGYSHDGDGQLSDMNDYIMDLNGEWFGVDEGYLRKRYPPGSEIARTIMANTPRGVEA